MVEQRGRAPNLLKPI